MSTLTKEQLRERARQKVKSLELAVTQTAFADSRAELEEELELARIALASLEAEPVAWKYRLVELSTGSADDWKLTSRKTESTQGERYKVEVVQLYAAPPAPVSVPDAVDYSDLDPASKDREIIEAIAECKGWNACRAAMLLSFGNSEQLEPVTTAYKLPEGWVACSPEWIERNGPCSCSDAPRIAFGSTGNHYHPYIFHNPIRDEKP